MTTSKKIRQELHDELVTCLAKTREKNPKIRSVMATLSQYWADEADDAVHLHVVASERATPVWPHPCDLTWDEDERKPIAGEVCWDCGEIVESPGINDNGEDAIAAFEPFCFEGGSQEESSATNNRPYAIARVVGEDRIELELVCDYHRSSADILVGHDDDVLEIGEPPPTTRRGIQLFALVCAHPDEDGPRQVLADYWLEQQDPRGEYVTLALSGKDPARADELLRTHVASWLYPVSRVIAWGSERFERGFLSHVDVLADEESAAAARGAAAWGIVESIRYVPSSEGVLDEAMLALKSIGPVQSEEFGVLANASRPWAIEDLHVQIDDAQAATILRDAKTLTKLRRLTVSGKVDVALPILAKASWWSQLDRLTVFGVLSIDAYPEIPQVAMHGEEDGFASGWELLHDHREKCTEVRMAGWSTTATRDTLAELLTGAPTLGPIRLRASKYWVPTAEDATYIAEACEKTVLL